MDLLKFTDEDFDQILFNRFKNPYIRCKKAELSPISEDKGVSGDHYLLKIFYQLDEIEQFETFFIKTIHMINNENSEEINKYLYKRERFFYGFLLKEFEKLGLDTTFAPKCYLIKEEETLVLENLELNKFQTKDKYIKFNMEELKSCIDSLAAYHGFSFIYELEKCKDEEKFSLFKKYPEIFDMKCCGMFDKWYKSGIDLWVRLIDDFLEGNEEMKKKLKECDYSELFKERSGYRKISSHGDLWSNNILFKKLNTKRLKVNFVDFQLMTYCYPVYDLLLLIYTNADREIRKTKILDLVDYYYEQLRRILGLKGYEVEEVFSKSEMIGSIDLVKYWAVVHVVGSQTVTGLPENVFKTVQKNLMEWLCDNRYELVKKTMNESEEYKKIIFDCLEDLEIVFKNDSI